MLECVLAAAGGRGWGLLEVFFAVLLAVLVAVVGAFFGFLIWQLFRNPGRRPHRL